MLRIIGGKHRGRAIAAPEGQATRPTASRAREALFNILVHANWRADGASPVVDARVLDAFAGSGALGLEALSRGAAHCVFVDQDAKVIEGLSDVLREWGAGSAQVELVGSTANQFLARAAQPFDLVFLDPPFAGDELARSSARLESGGWLSPGALIYVERPRDAPSLKLPASWQALRSGNAGAVGYDLYQRRQV